MGTEPHDGRTRKMRFLSGLLVLLFGLWLVVPAAADQRDDSTRPVGPVSAQVRVCFVPAQQCDAQIAAAIHGARQSIRVQAYGFTAPVILGALGDARERGVDVQVILDKSNDPFNRRDRSTDQPRLVGAQFTAAMGIPTWIDHRVAIAHNKVIVIDGKTVIGGSYNFTLSAEQRNAENVTFIDSPDVAKLYLSNWEARKAVSRAYVPPSSFDLGRAPALASANAGQR